VTNTKTNERPGTRAQLRHTIVSASKVREVLDLIRGLEVARAQEVLQFCDRGSAPVVEKLLLSAVANAEHNDGMVAEELYVSACYADEGRTLKRWRARARGRFTRVRKRTSHITIIVSRLPEDRLGRARARQAAEVAGRRARRVAGGRKAAKAATPAVEAPVVEVEELEEQGIVDPQAAAVEVIEETTQAEAADEAEVVEDVGQSPEDAETEAVSEPDDGELAPPPEGGV
jgi:large subunit ribosomal protein L22